MINDIDWIGLPIGTAIALGGAVYEFEGYDDGVVSLMPTNGLIRPMHLPIPEARALQDIRVLEEEDTSDIPVSKDENGFLAYLKKEDREQTLERLVFVRWTERVQARYPHWTTKKAIEAAIPLAVEEVCRRIFPHGRKSGSCETYCKPGYHTVRRWIRIYQENGLFGLRSRQSERGPKGSTDLDPRLVDIVNAAMDPVLRPGRHLKARRARQGHRLGRCRERG